MDFFSDDISIVNSVDFINWELFRNKTFFLTGATGLIGFSVVKLLYYINKQKGLNLHIIALVRDENRAKERFKGIDKDFIKYVIGNVESLPIIADKVNYVIHGASQTASKEIVQHAVETICTSIEGTINVLKMAQEKNVESLIYLSSMEVYGYPERGHLVGENAIGSFSPLNLRNSYPIGKIASEALCCAYSKENNVPAKIVRLTQTYGADVNYNDTRIFAYFMNCIKNKENIILKTAGDTERCYLHSLDAVTAILTVLLRGKNGKAYNAADESTYCSISEMAERIAANEGIKVIYDIRPAAENGFPETVYLHLDTTALRNLGWYPIKTLNY